MFGDESGLLDFNQECAVDFGAEASRCSEAELVDDPNFTSDAFQPAIGDRAWVKPTIVGVAPNGASTLYHVRRQRIWHQSGRFLRDTFLPVASPV